MSGAVVANELDHEMVTERAAWLRRRFVWFCGAGILVSIFFAILDLYGLHGHRGRERLGSVINVSETLIGLSLYVTGLVYVLRRRPSYSRMLWLAFWLVAVVGAIDLVLIRLVLQFSPRVEPEGTAAFGWALISPGLIFVLHLFPCLFVPWTWKESLRPAAVLVAVNAGIESLDAIRGASIVTAIISIFFSMLAVLPGSAICWLRFSRFRERFRLQFYRKHYRQLQQELMSARRIHESCLPAQRTDGPVRLSYVYEPTRHIGGDLLFVHCPCATDVNMLNAVALDVTGHGIAAALTVNRLLGEMERLFAENPDASPSLILSSLNRYIHLTLARHSMFATALCLRVDGERGTLEWASGGHPTAFLRRADGRVESLESTSMLLGVVDGREYESSVRRLSFLPGDALIAYTDGAAEAANPAGEQLCTEGVRRLVTEVAARSNDARDWPRAILRGVLAHRGAQPDDDTLVLTLYRPVEVSSATSDEPALRDYVLAGQ